MYLTPRPVPVLQVRRLTMQEGDEFLLLACDGIWDVLTNQQVLLPFERPCMSSLLRPGSVNAASWRPAR